jgi:hypothetical protein
MTHTDSIRVFVEIGQKKALAGAVDWPGWSRAARDEQTALQALLDYGPRYAAVMNAAGIAWQPPTAVPALLVVERPAGDGSTDFGVPGAILAADAAPIEPGEFERLRAVLRACWQAFDSAVARAAGKELRKGPRGGGRDLDKIVEHVVGGDQAYLTGLPWKYTRKPSATGVEELAPLRLAILEALQAAVDGKLPKQRARGGVIWPPRYFMRRSAWHILDHVWEIEDRVL